MSTKKLAVLPSVAEVRSQGEKLFFELVPGIQPTVASGYTLMAIISVNNKEQEVRDVSNSGDYSALVSQSQQPGTYFAIEGLYSFPESSGE